MAEQGARFYAEEYFTHLGDPFLNELVNSGADLDRIRYRLSRLATLEFDAIGLSDEGVSASLLAPGMLQTFDDALSQ